MAPGAGRFQVRSESRGISRWKSAVETTIRNSKEDAAKDDPSRGSRGQQLWEKALTSLAEHESLAESKPPPPVRLSRAPTSMLRDRQSKLTGAFSARQPPSARAKPQQSTKQLDLTEAFAVEQEPSNRVRI